LSDSGNDARFTVLSGSGPKSITIFTPVIPEIQSPFRLKTEPASSGGPQASIRLRVITL
jgi:hypothetical protein